MVPKKNHKSKKQVQIFEPSIPGGVTLSLVEFQNGERGFMAKGEDSSAMEFFDLDGEVIQSDPGLMMVIRTLGEYEPGDEAGFWDLVTRI